MHAFTDARPRPGTDRRRAAPLQETARAERTHQGVAQAEILREALRDPAPRRVAQAERHPQGQDTRQEGNISVRLSAQAVTAIAERGRPPRTIGARNSSTAPL